MSEIANHGLQKVDTLTPDERDRVEILFMHGPPGLLSVGMTPMEVHAFLQRPGVMQVMLALTSEFRQRDDALARQQFMSRRAISRLIPVAISVLRRSLAGEVYARDVSGNVIRDQTGDFVVEVPAPTSNMLTSAQDVLDRMGVVVDKKISIVGEVDLREIMATQVGDAPVASVEYDAGDLTEEQKALSREKRRNVVERLFPTIHSYMEQEKKRERAVGKRRVVQKRQNDKRKVKASGK